MNSSDKSIQMVGSSIEGTSDEMNEFLNTLLDSYKVDLHKRAKFYEFQSR